MTKPTGEVHRGMPTGGTYPGSAPIQPYSRAASQPQNSGLAIASLVLGIASWAPLPIIGSIAAIILGHMARAEIRRSNGGLAGDGMAVGGLVTGYSSLAVGCLAIPCIIMLFGGLAAIGAGLQP